MKNKKLKTDARPEPGTDTNPVINHWKRLPDEVVVSILRFLPQKDLVNVSLINKKFRDVSRDSSLWTKLVLDYEDIKQSANSCQKLIDRCKQLTSLVITNNSLNPRLLNLMSIVIRAEKSLKSLQVHSSIYRWSDAAFKKLCKMKQLQRIELTYVRNCHNPFDEIKLLSNLDQLEDLRVCVRTKFCDSRTIATAVAFLGTALNQFKKLKKVDLVIEDSTTVEPEPNPELHLHFWRMRPGPWEVVNEDGNNLHQLMIKNLEKN